MIDIETRERDGLNASGKGGVTEYFPLCEIRIFHKIITKDWTRCTSLFEKTPEMIFQDLNSQGPSKAMIFMCAWTAFS